MNPELDLLDKTPADPPQLQLKFYCHVIDTNLFLTNHDVIDVNLLSNHDVIDVNLLSTHDVVFNLPLFVDSINAGYPRSCF